MKLSFNQYFTNHQGAPGLRQTRHQALDMQ